ncbi:MAG: chitobiase/beta-hexosaminidase C-terminal domain-containing protein, partial [Verrucomicrobiota bacterium]|nr:chitobiase/beta-hexosaminidase C-terminal domain-containing protein [Verrucomicrobiota bacterium]
MNWVSSRRQAKRSVCAMVLGLGCWALTKPAFAELWINEFLAVNNRGLADGDGDTSDWIEIYNSGSKTIRLNGWALTDDAESPGKWLFPNVSLGARRYLVVFASGKNQTSGKDLHTNFKLNGNGEYLALVKPDGSMPVSEFKPSYPAQHEGVSYGVGTAGQQQFFDKPTPGKANGSGFAGFVQDTKFDTDRGFYDAPFEVKISCATTDAKIRYTVDGSIPTPKYGTIYRGPIPITTTTTLRAMAYRSGLRESNADTHTYLFVQDIIRQPARPAGFPTSWNGHPADYEMDPEVVNDRTYEGRVATALKSIPSLSLVLNRDDFFKTGQGIYPRGENVEKATSVELIYPNTKENAQVDGSVQIVGGSSTGRWKVDKLSMRLKFTSQFGDSSFQYPLFSEDAMNRFDTLVVDARLNNVWSYGGGSGPSDQRRRGQNTRDQFVADLQNQMGGYAPHGIHVHVYINGLYWGLHTLHERPDEHFAAHYLGGSKEDYDVMKHRKSTVVSGNSRSYNTLISATSKNLSSASAYTAVQQQLDITNFIDYMLLNFYVGNN